MTKIRIVYSDTENKFHAYRHYGQLRKWLESSNIDHTFEWEDTAVWAPTYVIIDNDEDALVAKIQFGLP